MYMYVSMNIPKYHRSLLAQFRCGILPIRIETGRYRGEPVSDRLCTLCSQDNVEDEYHFLLHCLKYSSLRTDFFNNIGYVSSPLMSDLDCIKFLLTNFPRQTAKFINSAYMYRQSLLCRKRYAYFLYILIIFNSDI